MVHGLLRRCEVHCKSFAQRACHEECCTQCIVRRDACDKCATSQGCVAGFQTESTKSCSMVGGVQSPYTFGSSVPLRGLLGGLRSNSGLDGRPELPKTAMSVTVETAFPASLTVRLSCYPCAAHATRYRLPSRRLRNMLVDCTDNVSQYSSELAAPAFFSDFAADRASVRCRWPSERHFGCAGAAGSLS